MKFRNFFENGSGLSKTDFTGLSLSDRMAQGRDIGETYIRNVLKEKHGIDIKPTTGYHADARLKIDGYLNGEPVQIKLRRSNRDNRNDIAYELVRNHDSSIPISQELSNPRQQGRDYKGSSVKHYFVMNQAETAVYHISSFSIRQAVNEAIKELESKFNGLLKRPFTCSNGVQLRPTTDRDPASFTPSKVMAFVPVESVGGKSYDITKSANDQQPEEKFTTAGAFQPSTNQQPLKTATPPLPKQIFDLNRTKPKT